MADPQNTALVKALADERRQPEMRSALAPQADAIMNATGLPTALGPYLSFLTRLGRATGDTVAEMTGVPWAARTGDQLAEALARDGTGLPSVSTAQAQEADRLQQLITQRASLDQQRASAIQERDAQLKGRDGRKAGRGPVYDDKNAEVQRLTNEMTALDKSIEFEQNQRSPEHQLKLQQERDASEEAKRAREANTPWRVKNPAWANALPNYAMALSFGMPAAIAATRNMRSFFPGSQEGQMRTAVSKALEARAAGDAPMSTIRDAEMRNLIARQPGIGKEIADAGMAAGAGGALSAEAAMFPDQWDAYNLPEGPMKDKAKSEARNVVNYLERGVMGALTGLSGYEGGRHLTPYRGANAELARALADNPLQPPPTSGPSSPPSSGPSLPPGVKLDKNGVAYDVHTGQKIKSRLLKGRED